MVTTTQQFSIAHFGDGGDFLPTPDGAIETKDQYLLLGLYSGIVDPETSGAPSVFWWMIFT